MATAPAAAAPPVVAASETFEYLRVPLNGDDDVYPVAKGITYRALVSVSNDYTKKQIADALSTRGWSGVTLYDPGDALPADWPTENTSSGLEGNHRWMRGEATRTGASDTLDRVSTLHALVSIHLSLYRIAGMWKKVPHPSQGTIIGPGSGPNGLDVGIPAPIAGAVLEAWANETDPAKLRELAATMRMANLPIASNVLDQHALYLTSAGVQSPGEQPATQSRGNAAAWFAGILASVAALAAHARR